MNILSAFLWSILIVSAKCTDMTTAPSEEVTEVLLFPGEEDKVVSEILEQNVEKSQQEPASSVINAVPSSQQVFLTATPRPSETVVPFHPPAVAPRSVVGHSGPSLLSPNVLSSIQRQIPPHFGNQFRPSIIRSQGSTFVALPPKVQPVFDTFLCQQHPDSNQKRDLEKRSLKFRTLDQFYLNSKNHDIMFSICGELMPAHRIVIESISSKFDAKINLLKEKAKDGLIEVNSIDDLLTPLPESERNGTTVSESAPKCLNDDFAKAFRILLKFFYVGGTAFAEIDNLDVGFFVWKMGAYLLDAESVEEQIEPHIGSLITLDNLTKMYRFVRQHQITSLTKRWSEFVASHSPALTQSGLLPLNCGQIAGDIEYLDRFVEALNVNQSLAISFIRQYLRTCPESSDFAVTGENPFPRSLQYFRCTIEDLKELISMGFIGYENFAQELENRLRAKELHCEEKCTPKFVPISNANYRHVANFNLSPGSTSWRS